MSTTVASETTAGPTPRPGRDIDYAELGLSVLLVAVGGFVLYDASQLGATLVQTGPIGPKAVPYAVGGMLLLTAALLTVDVLRGGHGEAEAGEDIDLGHGVDWPRLGLLVLVLLGSSLAIPYAGFPIAGTLLFWGSAVVLGSRRGLWDPVIAVVVAFGSYLVFSYSLGLALPAGLLEGVL
ncbi:MAG: tripartite tricarboxylate transporter TctB family protein [Actinomycetota bacterium]|nr:tripartite tricarboxylate transporter TctB family protein [Actinomycetota bacterium]